MSETTPQDPVVWLLGLLGSLGLLYDDILAMVNEAKARFPVLADVIDEVARQLTAVVGDKVKDVPALAALIVAQLSAGGADPDAGADV